MTKPLRTLASVSNEVETALYEVRKKIYPRAVHGRFAAWRWTLVWLTQLVFYGVPWLSWNGRQAVLFDLGARPSQLLPGRAGAQLAVTEVGHGEVVQVAVENGGVRLDGVRRDPEMARAVVGALPEVDRALERDTEDGDPGVGQRRPAGDEAGISRDQLVSLEEQGDRPGPDNPTFAALV